jgi:hypothetical protein
MASEPLLKVTIPNYADDDLINTIY